MSYPIERITEIIGARRIGNVSATIDWLLTDSRSLSFPEETLFFALPAKRNNGIRYIPDLYARGVRNFVVSEEDYRNEELRMKNGELGLTATAKSNSLFFILHDTLVNCLVVPSPLWYELNAGWCRGQTSDSASGLSTVFLKKENRTLP